MPRSSPLAPHRWVLAGVLILLALVAFLFLRGPATWQRRYYPIAHVEAIEAAAGRHRISPYLLAAVINAESGWDARTVSKAGAVGLMQVMPSTAADLQERGLVSEEFPAQKLADPAVNVEYGAAYLRHLVGRYHEIETALAAYNAGPKRADEWLRAGGDIREAIEFPETRHYVLQVARGKDRYEALYPDAFPGW